MKRDAMFKWVMATMFLAIGVCMLFSNTASAAQYFSEDFESVVLGPSSSPTEDPCAVAWTAIPPAGWTVENSGVPVGGVPEFTGWTFLSKKWWIDTAGNQDRGNFDLGQGVVAVADGDEWDDASPGPDGNMDTLLISPAIVISGSAANTLALTFDSSWRYEDDQTAVVTVSYDGGEEIEILRWESQNNGFFKKDATNENVAVRLSNPVDASNAVLTFKYLDAGNDWWWAIDNIAVVDDLVMKVIESDDSTVVDEDALGSESDDITVRLFQNPGAGKTVTVTFTPSGVTDFTLGGDGVASGNNRVLTFDSSDWDVDQVVTVNVIDDQVGAEDETYSVSVDVSSNNPAFDNYSVADIDVIILDGDAPGIEIWSENFDALPLLAPVDEESDDLTVWTDKGPFGWRIDNVICTIGLEDQGVTEWEGWAFVDPVFWSDVAGDQNRTLYTKGQNVIAVADPDEWDDKGDPDGLCRYFSFMTTSWIPLLNIDPNEIFLTFDSSWRDEDTQKAQLLATFNKTDPGVFAETPIPIFYTDNQVEMLFWDSDPGSVDNPNPFFKDDAENETLTISLADVFASTNFNPPADTKYMSFTFACVDAQNDWWWAVDNILVTSSEDINVVDNLLNITSPPLDLNEIGDPCTITISLNVIQAPTDNVIVCVDPNVIGNDVTLSGGELQADGSVYLTFTADNWDQPQQVTIDAVDDVLVEDLESGILMFSTDSDDPQFANGYVTSVLPVTVLSDDAGLLFVETGGDTVVFEEGETLDAATMVLGSEPVEDVKIVLSGYQDGDPNQLRIFINDVETDEYTFDSENWNVPASLSLFAVDDEKLEGDPHFVEVKAEFITNDPIFSQGDPDALVVEVRDNECGAWDFVESDFNQDCKVNLLDFEWLSSGFLRCTTPQEPGCERL